VFAQQISNSSGGGQRQPSPEEFIRALRGGGRGRDSQSRRSQQEQQMMTVGVDDRSNSLVVSAPDPLLRQVEQLVEQLDQAGVESEQTMRVVSIHRADPAVVSQALNSLLGGARVSTTNRTPTSSAAGGPSTRATGSGGSSAADQMRQRMMMFNALRNAGSAPPALPGRGPSGPSRGPVGSSRGR
jgi:type II secretory pathway component GspD/PulD (secretin)